MDGCVFCEIKAGSRERLLFEDNLCFVVPDKNPAEKGHLLVISNGHYTDMLDAPDEVAGHMFSVAKAFGQKLRSKLGAKALRISTNVGKEAGQVVFHFHIHVIPKYSMEHNAGRRGEPLSDAEFASLR